MINIDNASFSYGETRVLNNFSLKIGDGERICLFGESGCGKTTLLRLITGLEQPTSGSVATDQKRFSAVFQENRLLPFYTLAENIRVVGGNTSAAQEYFSKLGMNDCMQLYPKSLSGGMKRRAAIVRALSVPFDCLVLDEPFTGLDNDNIAAAAELINAELKGRTLILVTHSRHEAKLLNADIITLNKRLDKL